MSCSYVSSNDNRFYVGIESDYGQAASITGQSRIPAVKLVTEQRMERAERKDKTGSRTFAGAPPGGRKRTRYELRTYMTTWQDTAQEPGYGPLFRAALGAAARLHAGGTAATGSTATQIVFSADHGLVPGQAVQYGSEIRFVAGVPSSTSVTLNAPFTEAPPASGVLGATATYMPASELPSVTVFDYWSPAGVVQRLLNGAAVDKLKIDVNGDYHEFVFSGGAADIIDSASFEDGQAALSTYPEEPSSSDFDYTVVPGNLGQVWLGAAPEQFLTLTGATLQVGNDLDFRTREFGSTGPRCISAGVRSVALGFSVFEKNDEATKMLYQAARQGSPIGVMLQLGEQPGQLCGIYMKAVVPEVPAFDDGDRRLEWRFENCRAQGLSNDDISIAFG